MRHSRLSGKQVRYLWAVGFFKSGGKSPKVKSAVKSTVSKEAQSLLDRSKEVDLLVLKGEHERAYNLANLLSVEAYKLKDKNEKSKYPGHFTQLREEVEENAMLDNPNKVLPSRNTKKEEVKYTSQDARHKDNFKWTDTELSGLTDPPDPHLPRETRFALGDYQDLEYDNVNAKLRGQELEEIDGVVSTPGHKIDSMISAIRKGFQGAKPLSRDVKVYRGVTGKFATDLIRDLQSGKVKVGSTLTDAAFVSTTLSPEVAGKFVRPDGTNSLMLHIDVGKGSKVLSLGSLESEILLNADSRLVVSKFDDKKNPQNFTLSITGE